MESVLADLFYDLRSALPTWINAEDEFELNLEKLENHLNQLSACKRVRAATMEICDSFPGLQGRLVAKIHSKVCHISSSLVDAANEFEDGSRRIRGKCGLARQLSMDVESAKLLDDGIDGPSTRQQLAWADDVETALCLQEMKLRRVAESAADVKPGEKDKTIELSRNSFRFERDAKDRLQYIVNLTSALKPAA